MAKRKKCAATAWSASSRCWRPASVYNYNSFCHLKTSVGTMHGEYTMVTPSGETFEARIAPFTLAVPNALN